MYREHWRSRLNGDGGCLALLAACVACCTCGDAAEFQGLLLRRGRSQWTTEAEAYGYGYGYGDESASAAYGVGPGSSYMGYGSFGGAAVEGDHASQTDGVPVLAERHSGGESFAIIASGEQQLRLRGGSHGGSFGWGDEGDARLRFFWRRAAPQMRSELAVSNERSAGFGSLAELDDASEGTRAALERDESLLESWALGGLERGNDAASVRIVASQRMRAAQLPTTTLPPLAVTTTLAPVAATTTLPVITTLPPVAVTTTVLLYTSTTGAFTTTAPIYTSTMMTTTPLIQGDEGDNSHNVSKSDDEESSENEDDEESDEEESKSSKKKNETSEKKHEDSDDDDYGGNENNSGKVNASGAESEDYAEEAEEEEGEGWIMYVVNRPYLWPVCAGAVSSCAAGAAYAPMLMRMARMR